jgi:hypothetical protein
MLNRVNMIDVKECTRETIALTYLLNLAARP